MGTIITAGTAVIAPTIALSIESGRAAQNIVHPIIAREEPDVTLRPASTRSGRLSLGFEGATSEADSAAAEQLLSRPLVFSIVSDERTTLALSFIVQGRITRELEDQSRDAWVVSADYQEVSA